MPDLHLTATGVYRQVVIDAYTIGHLPVRVLSVSYLYAKRAR